MATRAKNKKTKASPPRVVTSYKGFDAQMRCRGFKFEVGQTYVYDGVVAACEGGFHACEYPLHVLRYYDARTSKFAIVEQSGDLSRDESDTKIASRSITIKASLDLPGLIKAAVEYTTSRAKPAKGSASSKNGFAVANTRDSGAATASGRSGAATASGRSGAATASGRSGAATANHSTAVALASQRGKARGVVGSALFLVERDDDGAITAAWAGIVGRDGIKPDTYYELRAGKPVEA